MSLENLYGRGKVVEEAKVVGNALRISASRETAHPENRAGWTAENPNYGHCDLYTEICKLIWARRVHGNPKWNPWAKIFVWWAYANYEAFLAGVKKNKLTVHYSFAHPVYDEIDLSRDQFPDGTYLHPRPKPLSDEVPVDRSWDKTSEMTRRKQRIGPDFISIFLGLPQPSKLTPELDSFLEGLARGEAFGLVK